MPTKLTNRESEIIQLISQGESTKDIAEKLHISIATVETHRKNIIKKLAVKNMIVAITKTYKSEKG